MVVEHKVWRLVVEAAWSGMAEKVRIWGGGGVDGVYVEWGL